MDDRSPTALGITTPAVTDDSPLLIDLGKHRRKHIRRLRRGEGKLMAEINETLADLEATRAPGAEPRQVIVIVTQKRRRRRTPFGVL